MRTRLLVAVAVIVIAFLGVATLRVLQRAPSPPPGAPAAAPTELSAAPASPAAMASPAEATASPGAPSAAPATLATNEASATPVPTVAAVPASSGASGPAASGAPATPPAALQTGPSAVPSAANPDDPNLLALSNGSFARTWTVGAASSGGNAVSVGGPYFINPAFRGAVSFVFELPAVAHVTRLGAAALAARPVHVRFATGTSRSAFAEAGTIEIPANTPAEHLLAVVRDARFVRATIERTPNTTVRMDGIAAYGTPGPPETASLAGTWMTADYTDGTDDHVFAGARGYVPETLPAKAGGIARMTVVHGDRIVEFACNARGAAWHGTIEKGVARGSGDKLQIAGNGKLFAGRLEGRAILAMRSKPDRGCSERVAGRGPTVLALFRDGSETTAEIDPTVIPGYRFDALPLFVLDDRHLRSAQFAVLVGDCAAGTDLDPGQARLLLDWVAAGHKLIIHDADECSSSDYSFIPYRFVTVATGARGAKGQVLALADPSALGAGPSDRAHALDTEAYLRVNGQQLGDADIMQTEDPHWCGHLYARNSVGASGWVHAYARHGRGLIIYNGLDRDDVTSRIRPALDILRYEYAFPVLNDLPCNSRVASRLVLFPSADRQFPAGKPATVRVPMTLAYFERAGAPKDIALSIAGDAHFAARISPAHVRLTSGATAPVTATIPLPVRWSGVHAFTVSANGGLGSTAQASIRIDGSVALARAFETQRRVRTYGIHFDVGSARIQPQSETTIAQIADVLRAHADWRMGVEGHTDSDGGAAYNQNLSVQRAQSVVNNLVTKYHIGRARLVAAGYGLTRPVAGNATEAGKALNRRVELVRL